MTPVCMCVRKNFFKKLPFYFFLKNNLYDDESLVMTNENYFLNWKFTEYHSTKIIFFKLTKKNSTTFFYLSNRFFIIGVNSTSKVDRV